MRRAAAAAPQRRPGASSCSSALLLALALLLGLCCSGARAFVLPPPSKQGVAVVPRGRSELVQPPTQQQAAEAGAAQQQQQHQQHQGAAGRRGGYGRQSVIMMPSSEPAVPYKAPGTDYHRYVGIYQRLYYGRVLLCGQFIDDNVANNIMSILWYLHKEDRHKPIYMYFNVPGALLRPALSVYDTMKSMSNEIETINIGLTTGMGAFLCSAGTKGRRFALPNARFLMQKTGFEEQVYGQASDIVLEVESTMKENTRFLKELSDITGRSEAQIKQDFKRDFYLSAEESVEYGMVDQVIIPGHKDPLSIADREVGFGKFASGDDQKYQPAFTPQSWS